MSLVDDIYRLISHRFQEKLHAVKQQYGAQANVMALQFNTDGICPFKHGNFSTYTCWPGVLKVMNTQYPWEHLLWYLIDGPKKPKKGTFDIYLKIALYYYQELQADLGLKYKDKTGTKKRLKLILFNATFDGPAADMVRYLTV